MNKFIKVLVLILFLQNPALACDLSQLNHLPQLNLVGEYHYDRDAVMQRDSILRGGAQGRFPVASELRKTPGEYSDPSNFPQSAFYPRDRARAVSEYGGNGNSHIYGIDSPELHSMTDMQVLALQVHGGYQRHIFSMIGIMNGSRDQLDYHAAALNQVSGQSQHRHIIEAIAAGREDLNRRGVSPSRFNIEMAMYLDENATITSDQMSSFVLDYHNAAVADYNNRHSARFGARAEPLTAERFERLRNACQTNDTGDRTYSMDPLKDCLSERVGLDPWLGLRDREFARNIQTMLCENSYDPTAFAVMGQKHIAGVQRILQEMSGGRLNITTFDATKADDRRRIELLMQNAGQPEAPESDDPVDSSL